MFKITALFFIIFLWILSCSSDQSQDEESSDSSDFAEILEDHQELLDSSVEIEDQDLQEDESAWIPIDLQQYLDVSTQEGYVRAFWSQSQDDLLEGEVARGRIGDLVLENDEVRFVIEGDVREIGSCPYGGHPIDAAKKVHGQWMHDAMGGICLFLNLGQTFKPDDWEILQEEGNAAIVAVSGHLELLDFIHLEGMFQAYLGYPIPWMPLDPDRIPKVKITVYYLLTPRDHALHVVTALKNEEDHVVHMLYGHLIDSGSSFPYNPLNQRGGFGISSLNMDNLTTDPLPFLGYQGVHKDQSSWAYMPRPHENLEADLPVSGTYVIVAGVAVSLLGSLNAVETLFTTPPQFPSKPGAINLEAGQVWVHDHWIWVGDHSLSSIIDDIYPALGLSTVQISGELRDAQGPVSGARVSLIQNGRSLNQALSDEQGHYQLEAPLGFDQYTLKVRRIGQWLETPPFELSEGQNMTQDLELDLRSHVVFHIQRSDGQGIPARISVICEAHCGTPPSSQEMDISSDRFPSGMAASEFSDVHGYAELYLRPGQYRIIVSRGPTWDIWPSDALESGGYLLDLEAGQEVELSPEIEEVVDLTGVLSGDFHVHAVQSPDSQVAQADRVRSFVGEGIDVMVSTDHATIADFKPYIQKLQVQDWIVNVHGEEITTADYGHYNAFPLQRDEEARNGGALDWANGPDSGLTPEQILDWAQSHPKEQVVQINHVDSGMISLLKADPLHRITLADPASFRIDPPQLVDEYSGDTGLWTDHFTAMEIMNGYGMDRVWSSMRWWMGMIGRGFVPTGTAVSDTHKLFKELGGAPRTFIFIDSPYDAIPQFDMDQFVSAVNNHRVIGSSGPFFRIKAINAAGQEKGMGEIIETQGEAIHFEIHVDVPLWLPVDQVDFYVNLDESNMPPAGEIWKDPIEPFESMSIDQWEEVEVSSGHWHKIADLEWTASFTQDSYVIAVVRHRNSVNLWPIFLSHGMIPFAFSNPILIDADGDGYNHPPLAEAAENIPQYIPKNKAFKKMSLRDKAMILKRMEQW